MNERNVKILFISFLLLVGILIPIVGFYICSLLPKEYIITFQNKQISNVTVKTHMETYYQYVSRVHYISHYEVKDFNFLISNNSEIINCSYHIEAEKKLTTDTYCNFELINGEYITIKGKFRNDIFIIDFLTKIK